MISRYTRPEMGRIWEDQAKYQRWLDVELAVTETLAEAGLIPADAAAEIKERASPGLWSQVLGTQGLVEIVAVLQLRSFVRLLGGVFGAAGASR